MGKETREADLAEGGISQETVGREGRPLLTSSESLEPLRGGTGFTSGTKRLKGGLRLFTSAPRTTPHWMRPWGAHRQAPHSEQLPQTRDPHKDVAPQLSRSLSLFVFKPPYLSGTDLQTRKCG